jgi:hypothetical protein
VVEEQLPLTVEGEAHGDVAAVGLLAAADIEPNVVLRLAHAPGAGDRLGVGKDIPR